MKVRLLISGWKSGLFSLELYYKNKFIYLNQFIVLRKLVENPELHNVAVAL